MFVLYLADVLRVRLHTDRVSRCTPRVLRVTCSSGTLAWAYLILHAHSTEREGESEFSFSEAVSVELAFETREGISSTLISPDIVRKIVSCYRFDALFFAPHFPYRLPPIAFQMDTFPKTTYQPVVEASNGARDVLQPSHFLDAHKNCSW